MFNLTKWSFIQSELLIPPSQSYLLSAQTENGCCQVYPGYFFNPIVHRPGPQGLVCLFLLQPTKSLVPAHVVQTSHSKPITQIAIIRFIANPLSTSLPTAYLNNLL